MVKRIGIGDELVMYLHFLVAAGEYDERLRMMGAEVREMFRGESAVKAPEWLLTLSDKRLAEKLAWEVGTAFDGGDFASYFEVAGAKLGHNPQAWVEKSTGAARAEGGGLMSHAPLMAKATPSIVSVFPAMILNEGDPDAALDRFHLPPEARGDGGNDGRPAERATGSGSGVIIPKDGYIVTNRHVMILPNGKAADSIRIELADKRQVSAELVGMDAMTDLA